MSPFQRTASFAILLCSLVLAFFWLYQALIVPVCFSIFLTYLLAPLVDRLETARVPRTVAITVTILVIMTLLFVAVGHVLPAIYREVQELVTRVPEALETVAQVWLPKIRAAILPFGIVDSEQLDAYLLDLRDFRTYFVQAQRALRALWFSAPKVLLSFVNVVLVPLLTFLLLKHLGRIQNLMVSLVPPDYLVAIRNFFISLDLLLRRMIKGQAIVAASLGVMYIVGLSIVGVQGAVVIGVVAGICRLIPYLDVVVGLTASLIVVFSEFQSWTPVVGVLIVFLVVQTIDGTVITPRVIGRSVGLHPVAVILTIIAFGEVFGFWGVLLSIPFLALSKVLWVVLYPWYQGSRIYRGS